MPLQPTVYNFNYLYTLKPSDVLTRWLNGFHSNGTWSAELSKCATLSMTATNATRQIIRRRINDNLYSLCHLFINVLYCLFIIINKRNPKDINEGILSQFSYEVFL